MVVLYLTSVAIRVVGILLASGLLHALLVRPLCNFYKSRRLGCGYVPLQPRGPFGIRAFVGLIRAHREQRVVQYTEQRVHLMGRWTYKFHMFGSTTFLTTDPRNVQALLATQFSDFVMARSRRTNLRSVLGRSIFAVDGAAWHSARDAVRLLFSRENIADLGLLERHVQVLLKYLEVGPDGSFANGGGWTGPVSLAALFPSLTLDSATELFLGTGTHSLGARLASRLQGGENEQQCSGERDFRWAFGRVQEILAVRLRLRNLYWLYGNRELAACVRILHGFVDAAIAAADLAPTKRKYDYLAALRARCADRAEVREQILGLLTAGRDTTAGLMGWVFYCLVRHPRVWAKLRAVVLETFGSYSGDSEITLQRITFHKLKSCTYLQHVLSETLRLHSIVAFNSRMAARDTTLPTGGGPDGTMPVFIPAGSEVAFSSHVMHRRKDLWGPDADQFVPERWETKRPGWSYIPFNGGPRICIGQQFALTEAGYVIVRMLQRYEAIEGLDVDPTRDYEYFTTIALPGSPSSPREAVRCRLRVAQDL